MSAFFISRIQILDLDKFQAYAKATGPSIDAFGGKLILRGQFQKALIGSAPEHITSIVEFPNTDAINNWFASPEYQNHTPLRNEAGEMEFLAYEIPAS